MVNLKEASDRSDRQYQEMQDELRADSFTNLCRQERLAEKRFWLRKREMEVTSNNVDEISVKDNEDQEVSSNEEQVTEQLDELAKNLKIVKATALGEEYHHSQADQVSTDILFAIHIYTVISVVLYCGLVLIPVHSVYVQKGYAFNRSVYAVSRWYCTTCFALGYIPLMTHIELCTTWK